MRKIAFINVIIAHLALSQASWGQTATKKVNQKNTSATSSTVENSSKSIEQTVSTSQSSTTTSNSPNNLLFGDVGNSNQSYAGAISMGYSSNLYERSSYSTSSQTNYSARIDYLGFRPNIFRAFISGYQEQNHGQESKLNDGFLAWVNNGFWKTGNVLTIGQQVRGIAPTSKDSHKRDEKILGVMVAPVFIVNMTPLGARGVTLVLIPQITKNFHKYEQNRFSKNNTEYSLNQVISLNWAVSDHLYFRNDFVYGQGWSYGGVKRDDAYQFASEVGYTFKNNINLAGGFSNTGAIRNLENGNDQTITLFDKKTASVYTELSYFF